MRRRTLLAALGATSVAGVAGYAALDAPTSPGTGDGSGPVRCRGDPVAAERTVEDVPGFADDVEYHPENRTVRYVRYWSGDEPVKFGTMSFERWAATESAEAGVERVRAATAERLGTDAFGSATGEPPGFRLPSGFHTWVAPVVTLHVSTEYEGDEVVRTPSVELSRLVEVAPRSVEATVSLAGDSYSRTVPVFAEHVAFSMD